MRPNPEAAVELPTQSLAREEAVQEDREGRHLRMRLIPDGDIEVRETVHLRRHLFRAHDDEDVISRNLREDLVDPLTVHREMDFGAAEVVEDPTPRDARLHVERTAESSHQVPDRPLKVGILRVHKDTPCAERARGERYVGRHAFVPGGSVPEPQDRDHRVSPRIG